MLLTQRAVAHSRTQRAEYVIASSRITLFWIGKYLHIKRIRAHTRTRIELFMKKEARQNAYIETHNNTRHSKLVFRSVAKLSTLYSTRIFTIFNIESVWMILLLFVSPLSTPISDIVPKNNILYIRFAAVLNLFYSSSSSIPLGRIQHRNVFITSNHK